MKDPGHKQCHIRPAVGLAVPGLPNHERGGPVVQPSLSELVVKPRSI
jgi:hypothetical protein